MLGHSESINMPSQTRALCRMRGYPELTVKAEKLIRKFNIEIKDIEHNKLYKHGWTCTRDDVTPEILKEVRELNEKTIELNTIIRKEFRSLYDTGFERVQDKDDWVTDFDILLKATFSLGSDDPAYDEDDDNILSEYNDDLPYCKNQTYNDLVNEQVNNVLTKMDERDIHKKMTPDEYCHNLMWYSELMNSNEFKYSDWDLMNKDYHSYIFHDLYDHQHLSFLEITRIKDIWLDMTIEYHNEKEYAFNNIGRED